MKMPSVSAAMVIAASLSTVALGQNVSSHRPYTTTLQHVEEAPRPVYLHGSYTRALEANCHPSRAALLVRTVQTSADDSFQQRANRVKVRAIRAQMSKAERREAAKLFHIQANYRKYQERQARAEQRIAARSRSREEDSEPPAPFTQVPRFASVR